MPQSDNTDDSTDPEKPADLDAELDIEKVERATPGEPFFLDVDFYAVTLQRIDLERGNETLAAWIRDALQGIVAPDADGDYVGRPADYTPTHDSPDGELIERVSAADPGDCLAVRVEFPAAILVAAWESGLADPLAEGIRRVASVRLAKIERRERLQPTVTVEVPPEIATRARLKAEYALVRKPDKNYHNALRDALLGLVEPQTEYVVEGGNVIASFDDDTAPDFSGASGATEGDHADR